MPYPLIGWLVVVVTNRLGYVICWHSIPSAIPTTYYHMHTYTYIGSPATNFHPNSIETTRQPNFLRTQLMLCHVFFQITPTTHLLHTPYSLSIYPHRLNFAKATTKSRTIDCCGVFFLPTTNVESWLGENDDRNSPKKSWQRSRDVDLAGPSQNKYQPSRNRAFAF